MTSRKCPQCGLVNFADASNCKRCDADLGASYEVSTVISAKEWPAPQSSNRINSKFVCLAAIGMGLFLELTLFVLKLTSYPNERSIWFVVILGIVYAVVAGCLSARRRASDWLLALSLSLFYLLGLSLYISELLGRNETYGGWFWTNKFYWSPILLFISIPLAAFFGARFGSKRSLLRFAALISVFVVASAATPYTETKDRPVKELNYSTAMPLRWAVAKVDPRGTHKNLCAHLCAQIAVDGLEVKIC